MRSTYSTASINIIKSPLMTKGRYIWSSLWNGTTKIEMFRISMPGYVPKALKLFFHEPPPKIQYQPYPCAPPNYRAKVQYTKAINKPSPLSKGDKTFSMQVTGTIIFYARAIGITMLPTLIYIASKQNSPTENTIKRFKNPSIMPHPKMSQSSRSTLVVCY